MSPAQKRAKVMDAYPGRSWDLKVQKMSDEQVHTVYMRLMNAGRISAKKSVARTSNR